METQKEKKTQTNLRYTGWMCFLERWETVLVIQSKEKAFKLDTPGERDEILKVKEINYSVKFRKVRKTTQSTCALFRIVLFY